MDVIRQSLNRDSGWTNYHSEELVEYIDQDNIIKKDSSFARLERKIVDLWDIGCLEKAIGKIDSYLEQNESLDLYEKGWLQQFCARMYMYWGIDDYLKSIRYKHTLTTKIYLESISYVMNILN